jgi:hypothetical protein
MFWTLEIPFKTGFTVHAYKCHENIAETKPTFFSTSSFFCISWQRHSLCALDHTDRAIANAIDKSFINVTIKAKSSS